MRHWRGYDADPERERRGYHHGNLKEALIEAARRFIAERGLGGFTLVDAAKLVGVTPAALYRHFRGREALVAEMRRVTRPGGLVALVEHNPWNPLTRLAVARCPFDDDAVLLGARAARGLLTAGGLAAVRSRHFLVLPATGPWVTAVERPLRALPLGAQYLAVGRT